jgi:hypothetical protein
MNKVTAIGGNTYTNLTSVKVIEIPHFITSIDVECFQNCPNLKMFTRNTFSATTPFLTSTHGMLYRSINNNTQVEIVSVPPKLRDSSFPTQQATYLYLGTLYAGTSEKPVAKIGPKAVTNNLNLTRVEFGGAADSLRLTEISDLAFSGCSNLGEFVFRNRLPPTIASNAFSGVKAGAKGYYPSGATGYSTLNIPGITFVPGNPP